MVATITFMPFTLAGSVTVLTSLDFLGIGLPPGSASLGELLSQGKANLQAPWLGLTGFFVIGLMLSLLIFVGEAVRDAFDPRKNVGLIMAHLDSVSTPLLTIDNLSVTFSTAAGPVEAVQQANLVVNRGETVALVGESGSGKSVTALSVLGLLPYPKATHPSGSIRFDDQELLGAGDRALMRIRGDRISMIFQEPMTSLNPLHSVEKQITEVLETKSEFKCPAGTRESD